ncbi:MAG: hypothetical protein GOU99_01215 [Candidatus Altiarchaeota archaeon]|nr:hypothetical protein [Candidatus Altiarchaeota archaeon]
MMYLVPIALCLVFPELYFVFLPISAMIAYYPIYLRNKRIEAIEAQLPEMLLKLSSVNQLDERSLLDLEIDGELGKLITKLKISWERTGRIPFERVSFSDRTILAFSAVQSGLRTGDSKILMESAEDLMTFSEIALERTAMMALQKYSLMGSVVVMSAVLSIIGSMVTESFLAYVLIQATLSAVWLSLIESKSSLLLPYSVIFVSLAALTYFFTPALFS